jgi:hypothetical protein
MKYLFSIASILFLLTSAGLTGFAQTGDQQEPTQNHAVIAQGSNAKLALQTRLSSKLSEVGDEVIATLYEPVRDGEGRIVLPRGIEFIGRVAQVQAARRPQRQATMTIIFETVRMPYGVEKIAAVVTAIDDFTNDVKMRSKDEEGKVGGGRSGERTAKNAGIGGGLGSLGGVVIGAAGGGIGGVLGGAGGGALGGVLMTKGNDIKLDVGTILRIRFERDLSTPVESADQRQSL